MTTADITVEGLSAAYPKSPEPALDDLSLHVEAGEIVALAGPSGCGKSTLLAVLLGFVAAQSGAVRVGGRDRAELDAGAWRAQLAWVPQRPHLFARSYRRKRAARPPRAPRRRRWQLAIAAAGLSDVVAGLPRPGSTVLGERGAGLSAG